MFSRFWRRRRRGGITQKEILRERAVRRRDRMNRTGRCPRKRNSKAHSYMLSLLVM